ncbi:MAG: hypothetical protein WA104_01120 [Thermodesulfovibrionales bacterium]
MGGDILSCIEEICGYSVSDAHLASLLSRVSEYAEIYLLAKQRQKGGDEMGEVATRLTSGFF